METEHNYLSEFIFQRIIAGMKYFRLYSFSKETSAFLALYK